MDRLRRWDQRAAERLNALARRGRLRQRVVAALARWLPAAEIALTAVLGLSGRPGAAMRVLAAVAAVYAATAAAGRRWQRRRPFAALDQVQHLVAHAPHRSFPSRHVASAIAMAVVAGGARPGLGRVMGALAGLLAVARVGAGLHYPSDVAAGALVGLLVGGLLRPR